MQRSRAANMARAATMCTPHRRPAGMAARLPAELLPSPSSTWLRLPCGRFLVHSRRRLHGCLGEPNRGSTPTSRSVRCARTRPSAVEVDSKSTLNACRFKTR